MPYKTIDLCAGIGGIRKGFELTGRFKNVLSAEIDKYACKTYEHLFGENPFNDLTSCEFKEKVYSTSYDVLLAGFPCQTFSRQGLEEGFDDDTKGAIFFHIAEIIDKTRPRVIFLENVDNLVQHDEGNTFLKILDTLVHQEDYKIIGIAEDGAGGFVFNPHDFVRNSKCFGIPQNRPRTYIVGFDRKRFGSIVDSLPKALPMKNDLKLYSDLNDLLEFRADPKYYLSQGYFQTLIRHRARARKNGNGFGYKVVNDPSISKPVACTIMATGGSGKERNLVFDPQKSIPGLNYPTKHTPLNEQCVRFMTPREWGKLQGFINYAFVENGVDTFSFPKELSIAQQYKQFGNSVTIPVIETMAEFILKCLSSLGDVEPNN